ncbi:MAG: hypothetical protein ACRDQ2_17355, partial [Gaiellales bacterium]
MFGEPVTAVDIEQLPFDSGAVVFVRLCAALIAKALRNHVGAGAVPAVSERMNVPDHGVDAEVTIPSPGPVHETGGLIGPGRTIFQFKYRDASSADRSAILRTLERRLRGEFPRVAPTCDRYVLATNLDLSGTQRRKLEEGLLETCPSFAGHPLVLLGASEIATVLNANPDLRHVFFSNGALATLQTARDELKASYNTVGWPPFLNRERELHAVADFLRDSHGRLLEIVGPRYSGKTRLVLQALEHCPHFVAWAATPDVLSISHFRDLDMPESDVLLVVDRCNGSAANDVLEWARSRQTLKTIALREGQDTYTGRSSSQILSIGPLTSDATRQIVASVVPAASFLTQSWVSEASGGWPGLALHIAGLLRQEKISPSMNAEEIHANLGALVDEAYLGRLTATARQALSVVSLLPLVGVGGDRSVELEGLCRALGIPVSQVRMELPALERQGLIRSRGRFIAVQPPRLADHLASEALQRPDLNLAVLRIVLGEGAFLRF